MKMRKFSFNSHEFGEVETYTLFKTTLCEIHTFINEKYFIITTFINFIVYFNFPIFLESVRVY